MKRIALIGVAVLAAGYGLNAEAQDPAPRTQCLAWPVASGSVERGLNVMEAGAARAQPTILPEGWTPVGAAGGFEDTRNAGSYVGFTPVAYVVACR